MRVAIVGAGIAGLSLAWRLKVRGLDPVVLERHERPTGASIRNFGMVWLVGQKDPLAVELAQASSDLWMKASTEFGFWAERRGSLTLAYEEQELRVLQEFAATTGADRLILDPAESVRRCPLIRREGLKGALWSPTELAVDPREAAGALAAGLERLGVEIRWKTPVCSVDTGMVTTAWGEQIMADLVVAAPGPDLFSLLPKAAESLTLCRLQMMRLTGFPPGSIPHHLCAGLTLGHYANFQDCPSLGAVESLHLRKWAQQSRHGIHVLVAQRRDGSLTVGDSHHYGLSQDPWSQEEVDKAILEALDEFLPVDRLQVVERWQGWYNTARDRIFHLEEARPRVWALNLFGTGMTLSFGVAEHLAGKLI